MGDPWEIEGFRWEEKPNIKQIGKKNLKKQRNQKKIGKNQKNDFFFTENGLKCIRNPTKHL